ncbi:MAG: hypothetical protein U0871_18205 [Gemmataceae bacterium]
MVAFPTPSTDANPPITSTSPLEGEVAAVSAAHPAGGGCKFPSIGLSLSDRPADPTLLPVLRPAHLRVELDLTRPDFIDRLRHATAEANTLGAGVELALTMPDECDRQLESILLALEGRGRPRFCRHLLFRHGDWTASGDWTWHAVARLRHYQSRAVCYSGTQANFTELNRNRPPVELLDGVCYSIQPQEHAFDNASLVECCAAIADTVRTARSFCGDKPLSVGPITLRKRVNPYATGPWVPPPPDPRQGSLFGAAWTLGALKYLAESGAASATFYETTGPRGVTDGGRVFPLFHVLADANEWPGATVLKCVASDPLRFDALLLKRGTASRVMLANMAAEPLTVTVDWPFGPQVFARTLDETTFDLATADPVAFRASIGDTLPSTDGRLTLLLKPYAYVRLDG